MRKIVILGGGENQLPLINCAKSMNYYVILCDFRDKVPGALIADIHYKINTLNFDEVLSVCLKESPDGIISNSEPAMPIVAKICSHLGLEGNTFESVNKVISKSNFRQLQQDCNLYSPKSFNISCFDDINDLLRNIKFPIIIKPCECSGSRGTTKISKCDINTIKEAFEECLKYSRNSTVVIEEYVDMPSLTTIEGDIFVYNNDIFYDGLFYTTRNEMAPMVPMTYSSPLLEDENKINKIKYSIEQLVRKSGLKFGEFNIEGYFNQDDEFFVIEINPRQGGNEIPHFIYNSVGIDFTKLLVTLCVGDRTYFNLIQNKKQGTKYTIKHALYSYSDGIYDGIWFDESIKSKIVRVHEHVVLGNPIRKCIDSTDIIAIIDIECASIEDYKIMYHNISNLIKVCLS